MNRIIAGLAITGAVVAAVPPSAHADETKYVVDLAAVGVPQGKLADELLVGHSVCDAISQGAVPLDVATSLAHRAQVDLTAVEVIVGIAMVDLCPQYFPAKTPAQTPSSPSTAAGASMPVTIAGAIRSPIV